MVHFYNKWKGFGLFIIIIIILIEIIVEISIESWVGERILEMEWIKLQESMKTLNDNVNLIYMATWQSIYENNPKSFSSSSQYLSIHFFFSNRNGLLRFYTT